MKNVINKLNASLVLASIIVLIFITSCNSPAEAVGPCLSRHQTGRPQA